jgi:hypothetical protein
MRIIIKNNYLCKQITNLKVKENEKFIIEFWRIYYHLNVCNVMYDIRCAILKQ